MPLSQQTRATPMKMGTVLSRFPDDAAPCRAFQSGGFALGVLRTSWRGTARPFSPRSSFRKFAGGRFLRGAVFLKVPGDRQTFACNTTVIVSRRALLGGIASSAIALGGCANLGATSARFDASSLSVTYTARHNHAQAGEGGGRSRGRAGAGFNNDRRTGETVAA